MKAIIKNTKGKWIVDENGNKIFVDGGKVSFSGIKKVFKKLQITTKEK